MQIDKSKPGSISSVSLQPWSEGDLHLLHRLMGDPMMMKHLGGPETPEQIAQRHTRYLNLPETNRMLRINAQPGDIPVGNIGYWQDEWQGTPIYETGWMVLPEYQSHGIATMAAGIVVERARLEKRHAFLHACPSPANLASNAICRKLGFSLLGEFELEYPKGNPVPLNVWRLNLFS